MSTTAESIINSLSGLPPSEVDYVRQHLAALASFQPAAVDSPSEAKRVFAILADEMQAAGLADARDLAYHRLSNRKIFADKAKRLVEFVAEQHRDRRVQDGILRVGAQLLLKHFQRWAAEQDDVIVSIDVVARNIHKIPARLDREFPGYGACGLLHLLIPHP